MVAWNREPSISETLKYEGGYTNDPVDPGGPTNWGITIHDARLYWKKDATAGDVRSMPKAVAVDIYRQKYWAKMGCDDLPAGVDFATFDYGVNSGVGRALPVLKKVRVPSAVETVKRVCAERMAFLRRLKTFWRFGKGWTRRVVSVEAIGVKMALRGAGLGPLVTSETLKSESQRAATATKKDTAKATTTAVAPTATQAPETPVPVDVSSVDTVVLVVVGVAVAAAVAYFAWNAYVNWQRSKAYAEAAKEA